MADKYWVGGTDTWNATAGTKWALTSGGAGGAAVPTFSDNVYFDAASGAVTVTLTLAVIAALTCTGFTGSLTGTATLRMLGSLTLASGMTLSGNITFSLEGSGSQTITTAGKTIYQLMFNPSAAGIYTAQDAITATTLRFFSGTLNLKSGTTNTFTSVVDSTTSGSPVTLGASTTSAATISVASGNVSIKYATISYSTATGGATFTAGPGATDGGNNTGWIFLSSGNPLFELGA